MTDDDIQRRLTGPTATSNMRAKNLTSFGNSAASSFSGNPEWVKPNDLNGSATIKTQFVRASAFLRWTNGHVFARQKDQMGLFVRTIGIARGEAEIGLANIAFNIDRLIFHERRAATG